MRIDDALLGQLMGVGLGEYEAKEYAILSSLRMASARELHEKTKIPPRPDRRDA